MKFTSKSKEGGAPKKEEGISVGDLTADELLHAIANGDIGPQNVGGLSEKLRPILGSAEEDGIRTELRADTKFHNSGVTKALRKVMNGGNSEEFATLNEALHSFGQTHEDVLNAILGEEGSVPQMMLIMFRKDGTNLYKKVISDLPGEIISSERGRKHFCDTLLPKSLAEFSIKAGMRPIGIVFIIETQVTKVDQDVMSEYMKRTVRQDEISDLIHELMEEKGPEFMKELPRKLGVISIVDTVRRTTPLITGVIRLGEELPNGAQKCKLGEPIFDLTDPEFDDMKSGFVDGFAGTTNRVIEQIDKQTK